MKEEEEMREIKGRGMEGKEEGRKRILRRRKEVEQMIGRGGEEGEEE